MVLSVDQKECSADHCYGCGSASFTKVVKELGYTGDIPPSRVASTNALPAGTANAAMPVQNSAPSAPATMDKAALARYLKMKVKGATCKRFCALATLTIEGSDHSALTDCMKMASPNQASPPPPSFCQEQLDETAANLVGGWLNSQELIDKLLPSVHPAPSPPPQPASEIPEGGDALAQIAVVDADEEAWTTAARLIADGVTSRAVAKALNDRGYRLLNTENLPARALPFFEKAAATDRSYGMPRYSAAKCYAAMGNLAGVVRYLGEVRALGRGQKGRLMAARTDPAFAPVADEPEFQALFE
jgi:hypothetical protein